MFSFDLRTVQDEVDYGDFFFVELLKMKYPAVFNVLMLRDNRHAILETKRENNKNLYKLKSDGFDFLIERNKKIFELLNQNSIDNINNLIKKLFNEKDAVPLNSIRYVDNYYKYFNLTVSPKDIRRNEFLEVLDYSFEDAKPIIDKWFNDRNRGRLDILFYNYGLSDFEHFKQIQNYIYGIKKVSYSINLKNAVTNFHVALSNAGFYRESLKEFFKSGSEEQLDELIILLLFPEGIMDAYNGIFIEQLYQEGEEGNNLYSKAKSKELIISRFNEMHIKNFSFRLLFDTWKVMVNGKDFNAWDDDILNLTRDFAYYIIKNQFEVKKDIQILFNRDKEFDENEQNNAVKSEILYRKKYNVINDISEILTNEFIHISNTGTGSQFDDKKQRILFFRRLCFEFLVPSRKLFEFIEDMNIVSGKFDDYNLYESEILRFYPVEKEEFGQFDTDVFDLLAKKYHDSGKQQINLGPLAV